MAKAELGAGLKGHACSLPLPALLVPLPALQAPAQQIFVRWPHSKACLQQRQKRRCFLPGAYPSNLLAALASVVRRMANPPGVSVKKRRCFKRRGAHVFGGGQAPGIVRLLHGRCVLQLILVKSARGAVAVGFDVKCTATPGLPTARRINYSRFRKFPAPPWPHLLY